MLTLDEAIKHCEEKAKELYCKADEDYFFDGDWGKKIHCTECAKEHEQLAEWLTELKELRGQKQIVVIDPEIIRKAADALVEAIGQIDWNLLVNSYIEMQKEEKQ